MALLINIRFYVLITSVILASVIYFLNSNNITNIIRYYGLLAAIYLYFALLASPLVRVWPTFPFRALYIKARRAIGVSAFFFAFIHGNLAFFTVVGGFDGILKLPLEYQIGTLLGISSLLVLSLMACTSFDVIVEKLGFARWKILHKFVYYVGIAIVIHAFLLGTHIRGLERKTSWIFAIAVAILVLLELIRIFKFLKSKSLPSTSQPKV